jgi:DNA-binding MarR family transcriptional regulator
MNYFLTGANGGSELPNKQWTFITNHGAVLALIGQSETITAREIAARLGITERTVLRIIKDLESEGYIQIEKDGRVNNYTVYRNQPLRRPDQRDNRVAELLDVLDYE